MLDRLDESKALKVRNEKLALAGLFAARVSADIRNPLASIKINSQMLEAAVKGDPKNAALVNATLHDISQVEHVIRDLIELGQAGRAAACARRRQRGHSRRGAPARRPAEPPAGPDHADPP